jgi:hypothetical protein
MADQLTARGVLKRFADDSRLYIQGVEVTQFVISAELPPDLAEDARLHDELQKQSSVIVIDLNEDEQ